MWIPAPRPESRTGSAGMTGGVVFGGVGLWVSVGGHRDPPLRLRSGGVMRLLICLLFQFFVQSVMSLRHADTAVG